MKKREQFLLCVYSGALAEDIRCDSCNAQEIAQLAASIPEDKIPECAVNAAKVFLAYCSGRTVKPFGWMG